MRKSEDGPLPLQHPMIEHNCQEQALALVDPAQLAQPLRDPVPSLSEVKQDTRSQPGTLTPFYACHPKVVSCAPFATNIEVPHPVGVHIKRTANTAGLLTSRTRNIWMLYLFRADLLIHSPFIRLQFGGSSVLYVLLLRADVRSIKPHIRVFLFPFCPCFFRRKN